jgi:hypothetical protein
MGFVDIMTVIIAWLELDRMSVLLFKLSFVPDDEAQDIRDLLIENEIDFYETSAGILGFSMPGLWLQDETQLAKARALIDTYQRQRQGMAQQDYQNQLDSGQSRSVIDIFKEAPLRFIAYLLTIAIGGAIRAHISGIEVSLLGICCVNPSQKSVILQGCFRSNCHGSLK